MSSSQTSRQGQRALRKGALLALLALSLILAMPLSAAAQGPADAPDQTAAAAQAQSGPMIVERVHSGWMATPDVKVTDFDHRALPLLGGDVGWVSDQTIFFGGGGYWLVDNSRDRDLAYGGFVVQWLARSSEPVAFGLKGLIGGGSARLTQTVSEVIRVTQPVPFVDGRPDLSHMTPPALQTISVPVRLRDDFFVAEPEADVRVRLASFARLTAGIGYRFTAGERVSNSRLQGAVASFGVQFGGGF